MNHPPSHCVFISYSRQDTEFTEQLANDLHQAGICTWMDVDDVRPGRPFIEEIQRGLEKATHFLIVLSPNAVKSPWVQLEMSTAIMRVGEENLHLIPLLYRTCEIPLLWRNFPYIDFTKGYNGGYEALLKALENTGVPSKKRKRDQRGMKKSRAVLPYARCLEQIPPTEWQDLIYYLYHRYAERTPVQLAIELQGDPTLREQTVEFLRSYNPSIVRCLERVTSNSQI